MNGKIIKEAITFDDVLLVPAKSDVLPNEVSLKTRLTKEHTKYAYIRCCYGYSNRV